jgi:hypothetical protein
MLRIGLIACAVALLALPSSAPAEVLIPPDAGLRARLVDGNIVAMRFAPRLHRRVAGRLITLSCSKLPAPAGRGFYVVETGEERFRLPTRRRLVRRFVGRGYDYCTLYLRGRRPVVTFALNARGAVHVDETWKASTLATVLSIAAADEDNFLTPERFLASRRGQAFAHFQPIVALSSPSDTPPAGSLGYYSDGAQHAAAVILSSAGRRLFVEVEADSVLHTNVAEYLFGDIE